MPKFFSRGMFTFHGLKTCIPKEESFRSSFGMFSLQRVRIALSMQEFLSQSNKRTFRYFVAVDYPEEDKQQKRIKQHP